LLYWAVPTGKLTGLAYPPQARAPEQRRSKRKYRMEPPSGWFAEEKRGVDATGREVVGRQTDAANVVEAGLEGDAVSEEPVEAASPGESAARERRP
jgi:hypothetical protein